MKYRVIDSVVDFTDLKPMCHRCHFSTNYVLENMETEEWISPSYLTEEEIAEIKKELEKL